ncbi:MAG TPA: hypothetical protein VM223_09635, partial [Planctomycetota bacterium]|nr:hypothetical protein [Planctomycetota bacterium]
MIHFYADQTGTKDFSVLGGPIVDADDLGDISQALMEFKQEHELRASNPVKTAGWRENDRYRGMQKLEDA